MASKIRYSAGIVAWLAMGGPVLRSEIVDPYVPPDVGVRVTMSEPRLLMLGGAGRLEWGSVQSPHIWQLRDGRLIVRVTSV